LRKDRIYNVSDKSDKPDKSKKVKHSTLNVNKKIKKDTLR